MPMRWIAGLALFAVCGWTQVVGPNAAGVSMGHLHLRVSDVDAHKKLWIDVLGGQPGGKGGLEVVKFPGVVLAFAKGQPSGGTDGSSVNHLGFKVKDLDATKAKLTAAGATVDREMPETRQMFILFPDKIKVEFTEDKAMTRPIEHHHIHFFTESVEKTREWYVKMFEAVPGMRAKFQAADLPGVNLTFSPSETKTEPTKGRGVDHIGFEVKNLEAFCKKLEAAGVKFDVGYRRVERIGLSIAFLTDPFGTYIELTEGLDAY